MIKKMIVITLCFFAFVFLAAPANAYDPLITPNNIYGIGIINHSDLEDASRLANSNGGDWGYVTIVISEDNRNKEIWQRFMNDCRKLHLIPIVRIATSYKDGNWITPKIEEIDNWINFFNSLNWVTENKYIIIGNEPNHAKEWGGKINPSEYAIYLKTFAERLHNASNDYFVLNAALDQAANNSKTTMDENLYIDKMLKEVPDMFNLIDGWNSHSYPNPAFSGSKNGYGKKSVRGYEWELNKIKKNLPVFITETGWIKNKKNTDKIIADNLKYAYENIWSKDKRIVAVTPFILNYTEEPFKDFSWENLDGTFNQSFTTIQEIQKIKGEPSQKVSGEIIFNFLNPFTITDNENGISLIRNTGQNIWNNKNVEIKIEKGEAKIETIEMNDLTPFSTGLLVYKIKFPENNGLSDLKLGFFVSGQKIGNLFNGKIISF